MTNETKELKTYTMQELYEHPLEPMACLVDGLLAPGLYILGGSPKVGKSWMALQLCLAVCGGGAFLGRATRKSEVLYLALEDGPQRLHSRALRLADTAAFRRQKRPGPRHRRGRGGGFFSFWQRNTPARPGRAAQCAAFAGPGAGPAQRLRQVPATGMEV